MTNTVEKTPTSFFNFTHAVDAGAEKGLYLKVLSTYKDEGTDVHTFARNYLLILFII